MPKNIKLIFPEGMYILTKGKKDIKFMYKDVLQHEGSSLKYINKLNKVLKVL